MGGIGLSEYWSWVSWLGCILAWLPVVWTALAMAIGVPWIIWDGITHKRSAPDPQIVEVHVCQLLAMHNADAQETLGKEMLEAALSGNSGRHRLLKEVSIELFRRIADCNQPEKRDMQGRKLLRFL